MSWAQGEQLGHYKIQSLIRRGGTAAPPVYLACLEAMTRAGTKELEVTYAVKLK